jgi:alpha-tubulin suppressor-like RCC1 family protein
MADGSTRCFGDGGPAPASAATALAVGARDGASYACALGAAGDVSCWGKDRFGVLLARVGGATAIAAGGGRACAVVEGGAVECWGATLANPLEPVAASGPARVPSLEHVKRVAVGGDHACALDEGGAVFCWGNGFYGQLGDGKTANAHEPSHVAGLDGAVELSLGARHSCARDAEGAVSCWGDDGLGQLAQPGTSYVTSPHRTPAKVLLDGRAAQIAAGDAHTCARMEDGAVECWGSDEGCALGDDRASPFRASPARVAGVARAAQIAAGAHATCARFDDGSLSCWGKIGAGPARCSPSAASATN